MLINETKVKITTPTIAEHLKHLERLKLVTKKKEGKQRRSYEANWNKLTYLQKTIENEDALKRLTENEKTFTSFPIENQVIFLTNTLSLRNLEELKLEILNTIEPDKTFEHNIQCMLTHSFFDLWRYWFINHCKQTTNENKRIALKIVEYNIKQVQDVLFIKKPWKPQSA